MQVLANSIPGGRHHWIALLAIVFGAIMLPDYAPVLRLYGEPVQSAPNSETGNCPGAAFDYAAAARRYERKKQYEKAVDCARAALSYRPRDQRTRTYLVHLLGKAAWSFYRTDINKMERYAREALQIEPDNFRAFHYYGLALRNSGAAAKVQQSVKVLKKAQARNPDHPHVLDNLLLAYRRALASFAKEGDFQEVGMVARDLYRHKRLRAVDYKRYHISTRRIDEIVAWPFRLGAVGSRQAKSMVGPATALLKERPENYLLRYYLGVAISRAGKRKAGLESREQAYRDFLKIEAPDLTAFSIPVPLKGKLLHVGHPAPRAWPHSGLRKHSVDLMVQDQRGRNASAGQPVTIPLAGRVLYVVNNDVDHSRISVTVNKHMRYYMSHLELGSIPFKKGDQVRAGDRAGVLGKLKKEKPHLHIEFTNRYGVSHPFVFKRYRMQNGSIMNNRLPAEGTIFFNP